MSNTGLMCIAKRNARDRHQPGSSFFFATPFPRTKIIKVTAGFSVPAIVKKRELFAATFSDKLPLLLPRALPREKGMKYSTLADNGKGLAYCQVNCYLACDISYRQDKIS